MNASLFYKIILYYILVWGVFRLKIQIHFFLFFNPWMIGLVAFNCILLSTRDRPILVTKYVLFDFLQMHFFRIVYKNGCHYGSWLYFPLSSQHCDHPVITSCDKNSLPSSRNRTLPHIAACPLSYLLVIRCTVKELLLKSCFWPWHMDLRLKRSF